MQKWFSRGVFAVLIIGIIVFLSASYHGLTVLAQSHSIVLTWTAPTTGGAPTSYNVKRSTSAGTETTLASVTAPTTTYVDSAGVGGTKYFYVVTSVNSGGESGPSNEVSATFLVAAPSAPTALAATSN